MLTYPKSTMRVRRIPMHLSSGHVTLMPEKFYPPPLFFPNRTQGAGRTHDGLCPKFLVTSIFCGLVAQQTVQTVKILHQIHSKVYDHQKIQVDAEKSKVYNKSATS